MAVFLDAFLAPVPLWRRIRGGHWEKWWIDSPINGDVWHRVDHCTRESGIRPSGICRGTPVCESRG